MYKRGESRKKPNMDSPDEDPIILISAMEEELSALIINVVGLFFN
jgi:hypothetical protein